MTFLLNLILLVLVGLIVACGYRAWRGPDTADRLLSIELIVTLLSGLMVVLSLLLDLRMFVDIALVLAALSFIGTMGISRFVAEGKVF